MCLNQFELGFYPMHWKTLNQCIRLPGCFTNWKRSSLHVPHIRSLLVLPDLAGVPSPWDYRHSDPNDYLFFPAICLAAVIIPICLEFELIFTSFFLLLIHKILKAMTCLINHFIFLSLTKQTVRSVELNFYSI